jgi:hypothetical protein
MVVVQGGAQLSGIFMWICAHAHIAHCCVGQLMNHVHLHKCVERVLLSSLIVMNCHHAIDSKVHIM